LEIAQEYPNARFYLYDDGSKDGTENMLFGAKLPAAGIDIYPVNVGLRNIIIDFFGKVKNENYDILAKVDNDCVVPSNWLDKLLEVFRKSSVDILSPNVFPSQAAYLHGTEDSLGLGYRPAKMVGGLWAMRKKLIDGMTFESHDVLGIKGAFNLLQQIIIDKEAVAGWCPQVKVQDLGHWSGKHPDHIKTTEHELYYHEVGRNISW